LDYYLLGLSVKPVTDRRRSNLIHWSPTIAWRWRTRRRPKSKCNSLFRGCV